MVGVNKNSYIKQIMSAPYATTTKARRLKFGTEVSQEKSQTIVKPKLNFLHNVKNLINC